MAASMTRVRSKMHARRWVIAANFQKPEDYDIPLAPSAIVDGEAFIKAENTMKVRR